MSVPLKFPMSLPINHKVYTFDKCYDRVSGAYRYHITDGMHGYTAQAYTTCEMEEMELGRQMIMRMEAEMKTHPEYRHDGPTNEELRHPSVRHAWEEFQIIRKLVGWREEKY